MTKFKIQEVGLDTTTIRFSPSLSENDNFGYILTSIEANNDFIISGYIRRTLNSAKLFTKVSFLDNLKPTLKSHLDILGRKYIDTLFLDSNINLDFLPVLNELIEDNLVSHIGIDNPNSLEDLQNFIKELEKVNIKLGSVLLNICPLDFNLEIIEYCNANNITIVGINSFGGYLSAPRNIKTFTIPFLLSFSANYSNIVIVSGRDIIQSIEDKNYLKNLIGEESSSDYLLKKSIKKQVKELKKVIYTSISMDGEDMIIPYDDPEMIVMPEDFNFKIGSYKSNIKKSNIQVVEDSSITNEINDYLKIIYFPTDGTREDKFAVARYKVIEYINKLYSDWRLEMLKVGTSLLLISVIKDPTIKGHLFWKRLEPGESKQFYLMLPLNESDGILFKEIVLDEEEEKKAIERE